MLTSINFKSVQNLRFLIKLLILSSAIFFHSCDEVTPDMVTPNSTGLSGDVVVVCANDVWESNFGKAISEKLEQIQYGLNQPEAIFSVYQYPENGFSRSLKTHRNIIIADVSDKYPAEGAEIIFLENSWAKNQVVFKIKANNADEAARVFYKEADNIIYQLQQNELKRILHQIKKESNPRGEQQIADKHHVTFTFPDYGVVTENRDNFAWVRMKRKRGGDDNEEHTIEQGIFVWHYPFTENRTFSRDYQIIIRDSILQANVPGPSGGSYMTTQMLPGYQPKVKEINFNGEYALEMLGMWRVEGDFMSGPFKSITFLDKKRNRVVTIEGWVYAPKFDKREYLREMEAMIKSVQLLD